METDCASLVLARVSFLQGEDLAVADANSSRVMHDAEHYILEVQHRERWAAEDQAVDARLDENRARSWRSSAGCTNQGVLTDEEFAAQKQKVLAA